MPGPRVQHVGGELFVGVERRLAFATYAAVTEDDALLWEAQRRVTFNQLIAAGITKAEIGKHVARDGTCWIFFADLAAAVLVDAETRATIIDPSRLPPLKRSHTLAPDGDLVVAALSRLRFVMTGSHEENGMLAILKAAREAIQWVGTTSAPATGCGGTASGFRSIGRPSSCGWPTRFVRCLTPTPRPGSTP